MILQNDKNRRVVFILGSTGVGKTKVAEDIAVKILMESSFFGDDELGDKEGKEEEV